MKVGIILISTKSNTVYQYFYRIQSKIYQQHIISYCLVPWCVPSFCSLTQGMLFYFSFILYFVCQTYVVIILKLCLFEIWKYSILGGFKSVYCFICSIIHIDFDFIHCSLLVLLSGNTNLCWNVHNSWTCVQEEFFLPLIILVNFFLFFFII